MSRPALPCWVMSLLPAVLSLTHRGVKRCPSYRLALSLSRPLRPDAEGLAAAWLLGRYFVDRYFVDRYFVDRYFVVRYTTLH